VLRRATAQRFHRKKSGSASVLLAGFNFPASRWQDAIARNADLRIGSSQFHWLVDLLFTGQWLAS
jgi:hypothetical protein